MLRLCRTGRHGLRLSHRLEQSVDDLRLVLLAGSLDLFDLLVSLLVGLVLGLLVACGVLRLELLEFIFLGLAVGINLLLGLVTSLSYSLCPVCGLGNLSH